VADQDSAAWLRAVKHGQGLPGLRRLGSADTLVQAADCVVATIRNTG